MIYKHHCRIAKVTPKNGGATLNILPPSSRKTYTIDHGWGEVILIMHGDDKPITRERALYMIEACRYEILLP